MRGRGFGPGPRPGRMVGPGRHHPGPGGAAIQGMANIDTNITTPVVPADVPPADSSSDPTTTSVPTSTALVAVPEDDHPPSSSTKKDNVPAVADAAPTIPVLKKIEPSPATARSPKPPKRKRIIVPQRSCNGGLDFKFQTDPYNVPLRDLLSPQEYTQAIESVNETIRPARANKLDGALLVTGPLMVPLAVWGIRHNRQTKRRKKLLIEAIENFNAGHPTLYMRWNQDQVGGSFLSIESREEWLQRDGGMMKRTNVLRTGLEDSSAFV